MDHLCVFCGATLAIIAALHIALRYSHTVYQFRRPIFLQPFPENQPFSANVLTSTYGKTRNRTFNKHHYRVRPESIRWQYDLMPAPCDSRIVLVMAVISSPHGSEVRKAIRRTWGSLVEPRCGLKLMFVLGKIVSRPLQLKLTEESKQYGDILQSNQFDDHYRASSLKTLQLFQWCAAFCNTSNYVTRIDDDVWVNVPAYLKFFHEKSRRHQAIGGIIPRGTGVVRDPSHKAYLSREEFPRNTFPRYLQGAIFATPTKVLGRILAAHSVQTATVFLDDVYITGRLMALVNLSFVDMQPYLESEKVNLHECGHKDVLAIHHAKLKLMYSYWNSPCAKFQPVCWKGMKQARVFNKPNYIWMIHMVLFTSGCTGSAITGHGTQNLLSMYVIGILTIHLFIFWSNENMFFRSVRGY